MISDVKKAFPELDIPDIEKYFSENIKHWKNIYENNPEWGKVKKTGLYAKGERELNRMNVAKVLADEFTAFTFSEQVELSIGDKAIEKYVSECLENNGFWDNITRILPHAYALGGCAMKLFVHNDEIDIDYIHADRFIPVEWNGKIITAAIVVSKSTRNDKHYTLFEYYKFGKVTYKLYRSDSTATLGVRAELSELYEQLPETIDYGCETPVFVYFKPAVSNNAEYDTPLGMSVYANAIDTLKALDITFDSFSREVVLGKKRIIVPSQATTQYYDSKAESWMTAFDTDDEAYVVFNSDDSEDLKIIDNTLNLRIQEHVDAINSLLNILCFQTGLSAGTLSFDAVHGLKTATEVISEESKTQRTVKNNKNLFTEALEEIIQAIITLGRYLGHLPEGDIPEITIGWNDNVIIDDNTMIDNTIKLYNAGLLDIQTAIMRVNKCDEVTAKAMADKIKAEQSVGSADFFGEPQQTKETTEENPDAKE